MKKRKIVSLLMAATMIVSFATGCGGSDKKPSGKVEIDGKTYDAITNGSFIDAGKKVVVDKVEIEYLYIKEIK